MKNEKQYSALEVCEHLKISSWTLANWYRWERKIIKENNCPSYLPNPLRMENTKGKPRYWTETMLKQLKDFKDNIVIGRNGIYGKYSNPMYKPKDVVDK